ncbi:hypothetical protein DFH07DRAFT_854589 [Mycena maculata]|uniref:Uncharacterized protein n=1 Tax=Mycena maculata TaxID=230809 RepID=A0AAD7HNK7_9AGAR|nr:hypothetical protein DFH07DRAFT_854589 [Mycena maculata]
MSSAATVELGNGESPSPPNAPRNEAIAVSETLFCGSSQPLTHVEYCHLRLPSPIQILPITYATSESKEPTLSPPRSSSNGCGTLVHTSATPRRGEHGALVWRAPKSGAMDVVLVLEDKYVPRVMKTRRAGCGCARRPVGCAVCGNPLGAIVVPCRAHTGSDSPTQTPVYEFAPSAVSPPLPPVALPVPVPVRPAQPRFPPPPTFRTPAEANEYYTIRLNNALRLLETRAPGDPSRTAELDATQESLALIQQDTARMQQEAAQIRLETARMERDSALMRQEILRLEPGRNDPRTVGASPRVFIPPSALPPASLPP